MESRLLRAAKLLEWKLYDQFNGSYQEIALNFIKAVTRGGDPAQYKETDLFDEVVEVFKTQNNEYTIQPEKLPTEIPYISFDVPNDDSDQIKNALRVAMESKNKDKQKNLNVWQTFTQSTNKHNIENNKYKELFNIDKQEWYKLFPTLSYKLNSEGMRNKFNLDDYDENEFIPVFGDSNTFGMGLPEEYLWHQNLDDDLPIYNSGVVSGNLIDAYVLLTSMYNTKKFKKAYICIPHSERWTGVSNRGYFEGLTSGVHYFLKQYEDIDNVINQNTRQFYRWIATQSITNFCIANNIELKIWDRNTFMSAVWAVENDLYLPNWFHIFQNVEPKIKIVNQCDLPIKEWFKHTARDHIHFGADWHKSISTYFNNQQAI